MISSAQPTGRSKRRPWLKYAGFALGVLVLLVGVLYVIAFVRAVPPISAKVVDAVTGKPVSGVNVCVQVSTHSWDMQVVLRSEQSSSDGSGVFFFWPSLHHLALLQSWEGYAIRVTDPQTDFAPQCGGVLGAWEMTDFKAWPIYLGPGKGNKPKYFPVVFVDLGSSRRSMPPWTPMQREMGWWPPRRIQLIPVLENVSDCKQIELSSLAEDCRRLNTFAAAMALRENQDAESQVRAEELCREVDFETWSSVCQGRIKAASTLQRARQFRGDYKLTAGIPARDPNDWFPPSISGVRRIDGSMPDDGSLGTGRRMYIGTYSEPNSAMINVQIEEFSNDERAKARLQELPGGFPDHAPGTVTEEEASLGQKIERHRGPKESGAFWVSRNRVILIDSSEPFAKADDFVAEYLKMFPSTL
jgi:hypothetical protein